MTTLEEVNMKIAPLCAQLIRWKKVRNTLSTVNRLSPEVLVHIFKTLPIDEHPTRYFMIKPTWVPLMGVCTYWRDLICQTPTLWRSVSGCNTDWAQLCLERSQPCTIDVTVPEREDDSRTDVDMAMLIPHIARIRSLHFFALPLDGMQGLNTFLLKSFPILEVLVIASWLDSGDHVTAELEVTAARFPKLRILNLAFTAAPREPVVYSNLRSLVLYSCQFDSTSMDEFIQLLFHAVHLEELEVFCTIPVSPPASRTSEQKAVTLPQLKRLSITEISLEGTINLLGRISLAGVDEVRLQPTITETTEADFVATYSSLLPFDSVRCLPCVEHATYVELDVSGEVYTIKSDDRAKELDPSKRRLEICLDSEDRRIWDTALPHAMDNLNQIFRGAPIKTIGLYGGDLDAVNVESWTALFEAFPTLIRLRLIGAGEGLTKNMWTALRCASGGSERVVCPALRSIKFIDDINEDACDQPLFVPDDRVFTSEEMLSCLQYRAGNGARLKELGFFFMISEPTETNVAQLKALVDDITVRTPASYS